MFYFSIYVFILDALLLGFFSFTRFLEMRRHPNNTVNFHFYYASLYVSMGFVLYVCSGLLILYKVNYELIGLCTSGAAIFNSLGFNHFLLIPLYNWLSYKKYIIVEHITFYMVLLFAVTLIFAPPHPIFDMTNVIHWNFSPLSGALAALQMNIAFLGNVILLGMFFYRLKRLSFVNVIALMITFIMAGFGGTYQYVGNSSFILITSHIVLTLGMTVVFLSALRGQLNSA